MQWEEICGLAVGASQVKDDVWDMRPLMPSVVEKTSQKRINFGYIKAPGIRKLIKQYAYYKLGSAKPSTVIGIVNGRLPLLVRYMEERGMEDFGSFGREAYLDFIKYLREEKRPACNTGIAISCTIEEIVRIGQTYGWKVAGGRIFNGLSPMEIWGKQPKVKKVKPIPDDIYQQILFHAVHDEKDILTKAGIIIQSQTGLRIGEILSIKDGCMGKTAGGDDYLETEIRKTEKGDPVLHRVIINTLVKEAVCELSLKTKHLREESGMRELFLIRTNGTISVCKVGKWSSRRLASFIRRHDIRGADGELYHLRSHQFRATFVRELVRRKVPIAMIMKQYAHVSIEMTSYYLTLQEAEVREIYAEMVFSPGAVTAGMRAEEIREKLVVMYQGKTADEIAEIISGLSDTVGFNPLPTGVCLYDFRRGNCTEGDGCFFYNCPNFITEVQFYPVLKKELELMELEMSRLKELGNTREWQRQYVKYKYLRPLVEELEEKMHEKGTAV